MTVSTKPKHQPLKRRLGILGILVTLVLVLVLVLARAGNVGNERLMSDIELAHFPSLQISRDIEQQLKDIQRSFDDAVQSFDDQALDRAETLRDELMSSLDGWMATDAVDREVVADLGRSFELYFTHSQRTTERLIGGELGPDILDAIKQKDAAYNDLIAKIGRLTEHGRARMEQAFATARNNDRRAATIFGVITLIVLASIVVFWILCFTILKTVIKPLDDTARLADGLAQGDVTRRLEVRTKDEVGRMGQALNLAMERMQAAIAAIGDHSSSLASSSVRLSDIC